MLYRSGARHLLREAVTWLSVAGFGFAGVYYFDDLRSFAARTLAAAASGTEVALKEISPRPAKRTSGFERSVTLIAGKNGHFFARAYINGRPIAVLVDTGATQIAMTYKDAERLGLRPLGSDFTQMARTANGTARMAPVKLDSVRIGDVEVSDLRGSIAEQGKLDVTLLGMEFIRKLDRFELRGRELVLVE